MPGLASLLVSQVIPSNSHAKILAKNVSIQILSGLRHQEYDKKIEKIILNQ